MKGLDVSLQPSFSRLLMRFLRNISVNIRTGGMLLCGALGLIILMCSLKTSEATRWPAGKYGIPKPTSGCPCTDGFQWETGWRSQDTNGEHSNNTKSSEFHLDGVVDETMVNRSFCIKTEKTGDSNRPTWPKGRYCIYKYGRCPRGLTQGHVFWDDDNENNSNAKGGTLPGGVKDHTYDTEIRFCCRNDSGINDPVLLPAKDPFFLLAYESAECQMVKWAVASLEWIFYDTEDNSNSDKAEEAYPYEAGIKHPTIYYCYYRGCNKTLTGVKGTFHSPNYPRKYPDGQYCSWRIAVNPAQQIHLTFTNFSLQSENNTDGLYVYNGENATWEVIGVFYGGHPPPEEGIRSSSNHMFVIFKSDKNGSYTGFSASYNAINYLATTAATTTEVKNTHSLEGTPFSGERTPTSSGPTKLGDNKDQRKQSEEKDSNVIAVVVPVVALAFLVALLVVGFFYHKRRRTTKAEQETTKQVVYSRSNGETPMPLENPYYDQTDGGTPMSVENVCYDSELVIENRACYPEANDMYTEVKEREDMSKKDEKMGQENENPLYESSGRDTVCNPIYDSNLIVENTARSSEENHLYTEIDEESKNQKERSMSQKNKNSLNETAVGDAVFNPIYDSST